MFVIAVAIQASPLPALVESSLFYARAEVEQRKRNYENLFYIFDFGLDREAAAYFRGRADSYADVLANVIPERAIGSENQAEP